MKSKSLIFFVMFAVSVFFSSNGFAEDEVKYTTAQLNQIEQARQNVIKFNIIVYDLYNGQEFRKYEIPIIYGEIPLFPEIELPWNNCIVQLYGYNEHERILFSDEISLSSESVPEIVFSPKIERYQLVNIDYETTGEAIDVEFSIQPKSYTYWNINNGTIRIEAVIDIFKPGSLKVSYDNGRVERIDLSTVESFGTDYNYSIEGKSIATNQWSHLKDIFSGEGIVGIIKGNKEDWVTINLPLKSYNVWLQSDDSHPSAYQGAENLSLIIQDEQNMMYLDQNSQRTCSFGGEDDLFSPCVSVQLSGKVTFSIKELNELDNAGYKLFIIPTENEDDYILRTLLSDLLE